MKRCIAFLLLIGVSAHALADAPDYVHDVAPLLKKYCAGCHNPTQFEGALSLDTHANLAKGGEHGPIVVAGKSTESLMIKAITGKVDWAMPPDGEPQPTAEEVALLVRWIDAGAPGPIGGEPDPTALNVPKITPRGPVVDPLSALACSPNDDILAAGRYGTVDLLRRSDRSLLKQLTGHRGRITSLSFSADGQTLVVAAGEPGLVGQVRLWNVADGSLIAEFTGHRDALYAAILSPNGKLLATSSYDQTIKLWDVTSRKEQKTLTGHNDAVYDIAFRPDGRVLASASGDRTLKLWSVATGERLDTLSQSLKELYAVAFRPDGSQVAAAGVDNRIRVWNVSPAAKENTNPLAVSRFAHEGPIIKLVYSRDGSTLVSAGEDKAIKIWDASTMSLRGTLEKQPDWPAALAISPDGASLFVGRVDGSQADYPLGTVAAATAAAARLPEFPQLVSYGDQPPVDQLLKVAEVEPNQSPEQATPLTVPAVGTGVIKPAGQTPDADLFRFDAKAGERWIIETNASRSGSKLDSRIEVLDAQGRAIDSVLLRAVRDSELEFRGEDSNERGMRLSNYEEMSLNDLVYLEGEVIKHYRQRRGPDADADFYPEAGTRYTYFDTSARTHALAAKCYVVEPYAPGTQLPYNGLPVFPIHFENDDDGQRKLGSDSRVNFVSPADGTYLVRVTDVRGLGGDNFNYQVIVRRPQPDFKVTLGDQNPKVAAGSGKRIKVTVDRLDGFWGEVRVDVANVPPGYTVTVPIIVEAGHRVATGVLFANPDAMQPADEALAAMKFTATAHVVDKDVTKEIGNLGKIELIGKSKILVRLEPPQVAIAPGSTTTCKLSIERNGFNGIVNFEADNLPHGVIVDNIGLNGIQLLEGQTERTLTLAAEPWVANQTRPFELTANEEGAQSSLPIELQVRKP